MRKILFLVSLFFTSASFAQTERIKTCATDSMDNIEVQKDPSILIRRKELAEFTRQFVGPDQRVITPAGFIYTIPVVFHVMHNYGNENISKQQIHDAMDVLNLSFRKLNPDTSDVIQLFQPVFADPQIQFRLATIDPNGNCTDGIDRIKTKLTYFAGNNVKSLMDWPNDKYLNIWVVQNIASGAAGYSQYPGVADSIDGVEILSTYVIGPSGGNYVSRSLTHEVGHYLNLPHTWGSSNTPGLASNCSIDDGVFDTPNCLGSDPCCCDTNQNDCGPIANVQNYMDYASCHKMFTEGQKARMQAALNNSLSSRDNLWTQSNLLATGTEDGHVALTCVPKADFSDKKISVCAGATVFFNDKSWRGDATSWQWDFQGGTPATTYTQNTSTQYNVPGIYNVRLIASNSAGSDTLLRTMLVEVLSDTGTETLPYAESFETISIPGNGWAIENDGTSNAFAITSAAAFTGTKSVELFNQSNNGNHNTDVLLTPAFDLTNVSGTLLTFKYAFAAKINVDSSELKVFVSTNCGQNWIQRLLKASSALRTAPNTTGNFIPTSTQWATQTINLAQSQFSGQPSVRVKFEFNQENGNNFYIDDINIYGTNVGINEMLAGEYGVVIHPNPAYSAATLELELSESNSVKIDLYDLQGKKIADVEAKKLAKGKHQFEIPNKNYEGIYFVRISIGNDVFNQKIVFVK